MGTPAGQVTPPANSVRIALKASAVLLSLLTPFLVACAVVFLASVAWMQLSRDESGAWVAVALFAPALLTIFILRVVRQVMQRVPGLIVDERGFDGGWVAWAGGFVPWSNISSFRLTSDGNGRRRVHVFLVDEDAYLATRGLLVQWMPQLAPSPVSFDPDLLDIDTGYLLAMLDQLLAAHRNGSGRP